ncbi:MAG: O-antigen ligase family protein, partial [Clostridia bacterium]|nr:O-antigen ligase family protein [Clostridia bacterium]
MDKIQKTISALKDKRAVKNITVAYAFTVLTYQVLRFIIPVCQFLDTLHLDLLSPILAVIGFGIFAWDFLIDRVMFKVKYSFILLGVIGVLCLSTLLNFRYDFVGNVKAIIWQIVQMLVIFPLYKRVSYEEFKKLLKVYFAIISAIFLIANIVSLVQYYTLVRYNIISGSSISRQGFQEGRLFGVYSSPHFASVLNLVLAIGSVYCAVTFKNKYFKAYYIAAALFNFLYAICSATRSVIIGVACALFVAVFFKASSVLNGKKKLLPILNYSLSFILAVVVAVAGIAAFSLSSKGLSYTQRLVIENSDSIENGETELPEDLERPDISEENISNHRFEIWTNYITATSKNIKTVLFGMSPSGYMKYISDNFPDMFIVKYIKNNYPLMIEKGLIYDTHNAYVGVFAASGIVGSLLIIALLLFGFIRVVKHLNKGKVL